MSCLDYKPYFRRKSLKTDANFALNYIFTIHRLVLQPTETESLAKVQSGPLMRVLNQSFICPVFFDLTGKTGRFHKNNENSTDSDFDKMLRAN